MHTKRTRREFLRASAMAAVSMTFPLGRLLSQQQSRPNFVIIFLDDSGFSDFSPFSNPDYPTPNVNQLASEGCQYNNFYVPQAICSASRAALLTGCYPGRTKVFGAHAPRARGLDPKYATMGEVLQRAGYTTASFGKWHIGDQPETRPPARGFDESSGLMYSNDMWAYHPTNPDYWGKEPLQYWENGEVKINDVTPKEQNMLTTWYTEHAVDFINRNSDDPFFLYVPHAMPHVPLFVSEKFQGKSGAGLYGDVMMEIDWSVGQIMKALEVNGVDENTFVIFTSDNGPWTSYGDHAGTTPYREAKGTSFDGGVRSATIMKYPGEIEAGSESNDAICSIDLMPTIANLAGADLPENEIDGKNVWDLITMKPGAENPHDYYAFSNGNDFQGVMSGDGRWKLHVPHEYRHVETFGQDGFPGNYIQKEIELALFDMKSDPYERMNVIADHPEVARQLQKWADQHEKRFYNE